MARRSKIVNGNLTCVECGSTEFKVNTTHSVEDGQVGRIVMDEVECANCAAAQIPLGEGGVDLAEDDRRYVKPTTYEERGEG